jgi:hypothetical protein
LVEGGHGESTGPFKGGIAGFSCQSGGGVIEVGGSTDEIPGTIFISIIKISIDCKSASSLVKSGFITRGNVLGPGGGVYSHVIDGFEDSDGSIFGIAITTSIRNSGIACSDI